MIEVNEILTDDKANKMMLELEKLHHLKINSKYDDSIDYIMSIDGGMFFEVCEQYHDEIACYIKRVA